jgi:hypothetical protein
MPGIHSPLLFRVVDAILRFFGLHNGVVAQIWLFERSLCLPDVDRHQQTFSDVGE